MNIRIADKTDTPIIYSCIRGLAEYVGDLSIFTATEKSISQLVFGPNSNCIVFIVENNKIPKGFALCFKTISTFTASYQLYIEDLFVFPEYRHNKIGTTLLEYIFSFSKTSGYKKVEWSTRPENKNAQIFYEKLGAKKNNKINYYKTTQ